MMATVDERDDWEGMSQSYISFALRCAAGDDRLAWRVWTNSNKNFNGYQGEKNEINRMGFGAASAFMRNPNGIG